MKTTNIKSLISFKMKQCEILWDNHENSFNGRIYTNKVSPDFKILTEEIKVLLVLHSRELPIEFAMEIMGRLGEEVIVINNKDRYAISDMCFNRVINKKNDKVAYYQVSVESKYWKRSVRKALEKYLVEKITI